MRPGARPARRPRLAVPRDYRESALVADVDLVDLFVERVADYRAAVVRCAPRTTSRRTIAAALDGARAVVPA